MKSDFDKSLILQKHLAECDATSQEAREQLIVHIDAFEALALCPSSDLKEKAVLALEVYVYATIAARDLEQYEEIVLRAINSLSSLCAPDLNVEGVLTSYQRNIEACYTGLIDVYYDNGGEQGIPTPKPIEPLSKLFDRIRKRRKQLGPFLKSDESWNSYARAGLE